MNNVKTYTLIPRDLLFFRDARPMDVQKDLQADFRPVGHGANWPRPDILHNAVMHELIRRPDNPEKFDYQSVKDLKVMGPFPCKGDNLYLPMPLDWDMKLEALNGEQGSTNLPAPLSHGYYDRCLEKKKYPKWISLNEYERYLTGDVGANKPKDKADNPESETLYLKALRNGITIDRKTNASKRTEGQYSGRYQAEYLELCKDVAMVCEINQASKPMPEDGHTMIFGGQGGSIVYKQTGALRSRLEKLPKGVETCYVRWTLISPAVYNAGWHPGWIDEATGKVLLPKGDNKDVKFEDSAKLIAARIGNAIYFSGWDTQEREKPTLLAVPEGSCYVFKCDSVETARALVEKLHLTRRSDQLGEKGFGIGLCSYVQEPETVDLFKK